ncbi:portal protein [Anaerovorax sp. IOR16]|uniref:portal protein n=1 Tax=Anaerovorax sp. IOR16 TaxID=2773458 RepID=UPI0019D0FD60|nr:hypothetical protein [Anaerovorax sp. IOR16]
MNKTKDWIKLENGKKFNNSLNPSYYETIDLNIAFEQGDQWRGIETNGLPTPVLNFIKRAIQMFVASITSSKISLQYTPLTYREGTEDESEIANKEAKDLVTAEVANIFEKVKMDNRIRDAIKDGAITGDYAGHWYFDTTRKPYGGTLGDAEGEICFELVDGSNVYFGNPNNPSTDTRVQPYIQVTGRAMVEHLKREAEFHKQNAEEVTSDSDTYYVAGDNGKIEIKGDDFGKASYVITYTYDHKTQTIKASKSTETAIIYENEETGLTYYPISWGNWEKQKNCYHGNSLCSGIIPNQILINRMLFLIVLHQMNNAFQKPIYNAEKITEWTNDVGSAIAVQGLESGEKVRDFAAYLQAGDISAAIVRVFEMTIQYTKEVLGINDAMSGNINPETASGRSIAITVQQSNIPLDNPKSNLYEWMEDNGKIIMDMIATYYGTRKIVVDGALVEYDFSQLKNMWLNTKCDVGPSTYWSEIAQVEMLDNLLSMRDPLFDLITYLEALPESYQNKELIKTLKEKQKELDDMQKLKKPDYEQMAQFVESLPKEVQIQLEELRNSDPQAYETQIMEMMGGMENGTPMPEM